MTRIAVLCIAFACASFVVGGCGNVSVGQQEAKVKAMDDVAKTDPHYADKQAQRGGREGRD